MVKGLFTRNVTIPGPMNVTVKVPLTDTMAFRRIHFIKGIVSTGTMLNFDNHGHGDGHVTCKQTFKLSKLTQYNKYIYGFKNHNPTNLNIDWASPTRILQHLEKLKKVHVTQDRTESNINHTDNITHAIDYSVHFLKIIILVLKF